MADQSSKMFWKAAKGVISSLDKLLVVIYEERWRKYLESMDKA
jgi:hypothetical protein